MINFLINLVFPNPENVSTFFQQVSYFNSLTDVGQGGVLGIIFLVVFGAVLFLMIRGFGTERAAGTSFFITGVVAVLFRIIGLINNTVLTVSIILVVFGIYLLIKDASTYEA